MNEDIQNWKYNRVQKYAGTLGLPRTGKVCFNNQNICLFFNSEKPIEIFKKIELIQRIRDHFKEVEDKSKISPNMNELSILTDDNSFNHVQSKLTCETIRINNDLKNNVSPMVGSTPISRKRSISATAVVSAKTTKKQDEEIDDAKKTETVRSSRGARITRPVVNGVEISECVYPMGFPFKEFMNLLTPLFQDKDRLVQPSSNQTKSMK
jgi:hypothetical protein